MKPHIDNKFDKKGFFICKKIGNTYEKICFGKAFNFEYFIECIKNRKVIFDSGMYDGNIRNYSQFRGSCFWNELHQPKRKMRQDYLFLYILKLCFS